MPSYDGSLVLTDRFFFCLAARLRTTRFGLYNLATLSKDNTGNTTPKGGKMIPYLRIGNLKNHTLSGGTYLYSPYMGVPPPPPGVQII